MDKTNNNKPTMMESCVMAGFSSPAEQYIEQALDLNELLVKHPAGTFFVRVAGDSMIQAGIYLWLTKLRYTLRL